MAIRVKKEKKRNNEIERIMSKHEFMKASELIKKLQDLVAEHGDMEVRADGCCDPYPHVVTCYERPYIEI